MHFKEFHAERVHRRATLDRVLLKCIYFSGNPFVTGLWVDDAEALGATKLREAVVVRIRV